MICLVNPRSRCIKESLSSSERQLILHWVSADRKNVFQRAGFFLTKIFHPNIRQPSGEICVNTLKKDWEPSHGIRHVLMVIRCLLIEPFPESALNEEAAKLMLEDYDEYFRRAKMFTGIHAKPCRGLSASEVGGAEGSSSTAENPAMKKAKNEKKMDKKKSLRRL